MNSVNENFILSPSIHLADAFLMRFLKVCDNDLTKAQELLMFNYKLRSSAPNLFTKRDIKAEEIQTAADIM
jgi:hypothetical protein